MHTFIIVPTGFGVGLTSISLGMVRALERSGLKVGFCKPIAQNQVGDTGPERSSELIAQTHAITPPKPLPLEHVEHMLIEGQLDALLEQVVHLCQQASIGKDVLLVEGMVTNHQASYAAQANARLAQGLNAEVILVSAPDGENLEQLTDRIDIQASQFGGCKDPQVLGVIFNKVRDENFTAQLKSQTQMFNSDNFRLLGCIPWNAELNAPRTSDIAEQMQAQILNEGEYRQRRVLEILLFARAVHNSVELLKPGVLVVTPGDRDDIILAACLAAMNGVPLAGLLLSGNFPPDPRILELCQGAMQAGLPLMTVATGSYATAHNLQQINREIPLDDPERAEKVTDFVAGYLDQAWLHDRCGTPQITRLSPPAFRYQLVQRAQTANKRIVLPEGSEPRTVQAAAICQARGIARCVLLAKPEAVATVAKALGIELPEGLEVLDPDLIRQRYVEPMVELRKNKGLTAPVASAQLEDTVVLGTMMLALGEVDGLVSGAIHTTANTIRPALQLIKTAPGYQLVSSIFFMLLPEQVVVYGDCAVNPDPTAAELAEIALQSAASAEAFGIEPRVAMISYSTGNSGSGSEVEKVREATRLAREKNPQLLIDGPLQYDAAAIESVGRQKAPDSPVAGRATVFIFPDLNTGNTTYKAVQRSASVVSVGPMLQGLLKPVNDLSRGALVDDIVYTIALTAVQGDAQP
jgi:phosphate acetyltransferase